MKVDTEIVSKKRQLDLLIGALEGGSNYWYFLPDLSMCPGEGEAKTKEVQEDSLGKEWSKYAVMRIWEALHQGAKIPINDNEDREELLGYLTLESLDTSLSLMIEKYPWHFANIIKEDDDCETADVFLQLAVLGDIVYG